MIGPLPERIDWFGDEQNLMREHNRQYRERRAKDWMIQLLMTDPVIWSYAEQFLGEEMVQQPKQTRGIYCTFPQGDRQPQNPKCDGEAHPFHFGVVGHFDTVPLYDGGLKIWPGSHRKLYYAFTSRYRSRPAENCERDIEQFNRQRDMALYGEAGDVLFWHQRIAHSGRHRHARQIRQAVQYYFRKKDVDQKVVLAPAEEMWEDWYDEVRSAPCDNHAMNQG